jgi:hypothetical protein
MAHDGDDGDDDDGDDTIKLESFAGLSTSLP